MPPKGAKGKKGSNAAPPQAKKAKVAPPPAEDSDEDSDDSEDEEEEEPVRKVPQQKANKGKAAPPPEDSDEEDDSDDEVAAAAVDDDDDDDDDDDEDNDDDESDEEAKVPPKAKKVAAPAKDDDDDDDEDEDDDEDDEEDFDDDDDDGQAVNGKRKKEKQQDKPSKKQKVDDDSVCIFIGNLPKEMDEDKLKKLLKKNGVSAKEIRKPAKKRFAHVDLENEEDLPAALKLNGKQIGDTTLKVEQAKTKLDASFETPKKPDEARKSFGGKDDATLFVKNLAEDTTEESLKEFFPGSVEIRMPRKPDDSHKGFAYVVFKDKSDVDEALSDKQGSELDGNALFLDRAGSKPQTPGGGDKRKSVGEAGKTKVLFVKNLSFDTDEHALKKAFEGASSARIAKFQDTGKHRGFGFVEFDSAEDAQEAYNSMKGKEIDGRQIFVDFAGERGAGGGGGGGDRRGGGRGGFGGGGRGGGFRGGRGGGGRGGGFRGGRGGGGRGGQGGFRGKKTKFDD